MSGLGFFKSAAPWISKALELGGPYGQLAGSVLNKVIGVKADATPDDLASAFAQSADKQKFLLDMKAADNAFSEHMKQMDIQSVDDLAKIDAADRADARNREIQVKDWTPRIFGGLVLVLFAAVVVGALFFNVKAESTLAGMLIGFASSEAKQVLSYYFGTSAGSDRKTELLAAKDN